MLSCLHTTGGVAEIFMWYARGNGRECWFPCQAATRMTQNVFIEVQRGGACKKNAVGKVGG